MRERRGKGVGGGQVWGVIARRYMWWLWGVVRTYTLQRESVKCRLQNNRITFNWLEMKMLWTLPTWHVQLPSGEIHVALSLLSAVEELWTLDRPSTVALQLELTSALVLNLCEGTTIEVSSTLTAEDWVIHVYLRLNAQTERIKLAAAKCKATNSRYPDRDWRSFWVSL